MNRRLFGKASAPHWSCWQYLRSAARGARFVARANRTKPRPRKRARRPKAADSAPPADVDPDSLASPKLKGYYDKGYKIGMHFADNLQKDIKGGLSPEDIAKTVKKELARGITPSTWPGNSTARTANPCSRRMAGGRVSGRFGPAQESPPKAPGKLRPRRRKMKSPRPARSRKKTSRRPTRKMNKGVAEADEGGATPAPVRRLTFNAHLVGGCGGVGWGVQVGGATARITENFAFKLSSPICSTTICAGAQCWATWPR